MASAELAEGGDGGRIAQRAGPEGWRALCRWLEELGSEDRASARAASGSLHTLLDAMDIPAIGRWMLAGLRLYGGDMPRMRRYFALQDRRSVEMMRKEAAEASLASAIPSLQYLLHALGGGDCSIQPRSQGELNGPPLRPVITAGALLVPDCYTAVDSPDRHLLYRAAVAHALAHMRHSPRGKPVEGLKPMAVAVVSLIEDARVERLIAQEYPGLHRVFLGFLRTAAGSSGLSFASLASRLALGLADPSCRDDSYWVDKGRRLFEQACVDLHDYARFRAIASVLANDLGQMRVRFNPQQYHVQAPYRDDNSFLWDYGQSTQPPLQALDLQREQRARLEGSAAPAGPDAAGPADPDFAAAPASRHVYPEWDYRIELMRHDWCTVFDRPLAWPAADSPVPPASSLPGHAPRLAVSACLSRARRLRRQREGEEIDLDAAVEVLTDRRLKLAPDPRIFMRPGREDAACSVLVLMDLSESANDSLRDGTDSVLGLEKKAAAYLAGAVRNRLVRLAIHGFSSNTRRQVDYYRLLEFGQVFDAGPRAVIDRARAAHSTRMGAALRHAAACLAGERAQRRAIIVMTDGAPADIDVHEAGYLVEDARMAVQGARKLGIGIFCLTLDRHAAGYARTIFGARNYQIVDEPARLPDRLGRVFARMAAL